MPKPTAIYTWATDTVYVGGPENGEANKVAVTSGKRAEGIEPGEEFAAQSMNEVLNSHGQWITYLDAGAWIGPITITGDLTATVSITTANVTSANVTVTNELEVQNNVNIVGELVVGGAFRHGDMVLNIPGSAGLAGNGTQTGEYERQFSGYSASIDIKTLPATANTTVSWPIPLRVGDQIKSVTFRVLGINTGIAGVISSADVSLINAAGTAVPLGSTSGTPSTVSVSSFTANVTDTVVGVNEHLFAAIVMAPVQDNEVGLRVYGVDVTYDRP